MKQSKCEIMYRQIYARHEQLKKIMEMMEIMLH